MNSYPAQANYRKEDTRILWAALVCVALIGVYATFSQLTAAGQSITTSPPSAQTAGRANNTAPPGAVKKAEATKTAPSRPAPTTTAPILPPFNTFPASSLELGEKLNAVWFGPAHWPALKSLWTRESNWNPNAVNRSSGACGIPQALPCSKITDMTPKGQIEWGLTYIERRYKNPTNALSHWRARGWY